MQLARPTNIVGILTGLSLAFALCSHTALAADIKFEDFPARPYTGPVSAPDLSSHPDARTYRTRIRRAAKGPVNFAGKYIVTTWGCGASCLHGVLQDAQTGRVFFLPHTICCGFDMGDDIKPIEFRRDSSLIVFKGLRDEEDPMGTHYYEFAENEFWLLKTVKFGPVSANPTVGSNPSADDDDGKIVRTVPGAMQLLPGYEHVPLVGIDSLVGRIEKNGGLQISYEIGHVQAPGEGRLGGSFSDRAKLSPSHETRWYREQTVNGQPVHTAFRNDDILLVSYPKSGMNFAAQIVNPSEMADALLMILTYRGNAE